MRSVHVAAMLIALMAAIRAHAQTSVTNTPEGFQSQFHAVFDAFRSPTSTELFASSVRAASLQDASPKSEIHQSVSSNDKESCLADSNVPSVIRPPATHELE